MARFRLLLAAAMLGTILLVPATANAAKPSTGYSIPITATAPSGFTITDAAFNLTRFALQNGQLVAVGTLTGNLTNILTGVITPISQVITIPISVAGTTCQILHLTLGPLDLNLLGLMIHLNQVVLNIDAQSGPGNLLGNLLCAVAGLLDSGGPLTGLVGLLNNILRLLG
jgi:hypothetical protein